MAEYFYTLDLGEKYGAKLQALAVQASFDDIEAFAAMILADALDSMESCAPAAGASGKPPSDCRTDGGFEGGQDMDDDIPF